MYKNRIGQWGFVKKLRYTVAFLNKPKTQDSGIRLGKRIQSILALRPERQMVNVLGNLKPANSAGHLLHWRTFAQGRSQALQRLPGYPPTIVPASDSGYRTASYCDPCQNDMHRVDDQPLDLPSQDCSDMNDSRITYSDTTSLSDPKVEGHLSVLVDNLLKSLVQCNLTKAVIENMCAALPGLLTSLALKLGYEASSTMHHDVMMFIYRYRR